MKIKYKDQLTKCYWSGALTAKLYNTFYTRSDLPSVIVCMKNYDILHTIFGKYYNLLRVNKIANPVVLKYEEFNNLTLRQTTTVVFTDFMLGYADYIKRDKIT